MMIPQFDSYKHRFQVVSKNAIEPGLESITCALEKVGNPHRKLKYVHVAGTNGKGSTIALMNSMLQAHGVRTACFYSPCFMDVHDQIQLNGQYITKEQMDRIFQIVKEAGLSGTVTDFELLTVVAFLAFEQFNPDVVLLETGMGGRYDSTNVITPMLSVIPSIAIEHEKFLGTSMVEVATHKAGIIKEERPAIIGLLDEAADQVMMEEASRVNAPLWKLGRDFTFADGCYRDGTGISIKDLSVSLQGHHQLNNAALAIRSVVYLSGILDIGLDENLIRKGLKETFIPGRFEKITDNLYFDGAHNPASAQALVDTISEVFPDSPIHFYVGMIEGKDSEKILRVFEKISNKFTFIDFNDERSMPARKLSKISASPTNNVTKEPLLEIEKNISGRDVIIVTGSLYLLANLRSKTMEIFNKI